ncbi:transglutaminase domain-containing protein [Ruminococcus sp.]|uniref:transglutaminase domain-containing protein n=1 Tax=Ruminococcus sp. TaxID=41978 RepID=UPI0025D5F883|nr:transglutaminase domain-containing protein [Ruminococcus sp.]MBQ8965312.1 fibronectin type III domain-containing protein [Ruminococcus sp.]
MSIKNRTAAFIMAAMTLTAGMTTAPAAFTGIISAKAEVIAYSKTPAAKTTYTSTDKDITISWDKVSGASGYYIYRWSEKAPAWIRVGTAASSADSYKDTKVGTGMSYKYYVVAYKKSGGKRIMSGRSNEISASTLPSTPEVIAHSEDSNYITVYWERVNCSGYELYYKQGSGEWKLASKINSGETTSADVTGLTSETVYSVKVRAFTKDSNGKLVYSEYSPELEIKTAPDFLYRRSSQALIDRLNSAQLDPGGNTYEECNRQNAEETKQTITISDADMATIKRFVDAHYTSDMTVGDFLDYTVQWLNKNVSYADGVHGPQYSEIWGRSHVDNCFNYKVGQCIQYNSTICAVMRYLGFDARVVQGWRGNSLDNKWQHFWCEVTINGTDYVMDSYNYGTDGDWYFVCATYAETAPYSYNSHYIMRNKLMAPYRAFSMKSENGTLRPV